MTTEQTTSPPRAGVGIVAQRLGQSVRGGRPILDDISLGIAPGELVAIIGASGAGKTTLLETLAGIRVPTTGSVAYDGVVTAGAIGVVPQDDIIHRELPLAHTLRYAARLRPARLAGPAGVVVLTTHQVTDVEHCDRVVVLTRQGRLAFAGTPAAARDFFGLRSLVEVHLRLDEAAHPAEWPARFAEQRQADPPAGPTQRDADPPASTSGDVDREAQAPRRVGRLRQWAVLTTRNAEIVARNRLTLAILLGSPLMVLGMFALLFRPGAFDPTRPSPAVTVMILFWIAFGGFFFGLTYGLLQICTELPILRRERLAGVRLAPYLLAKVAVLLPLLALVDLALLGVLRGIDRLPPVGGADFAALYATVLLSSAAALALGLLCSAAVSDAAQATLLLPMLCFPQVLFVGAILPVPAMAVGGQWLSYAMSNRWAFEGLGHTAGVERLWRDGGSPLGPPLLATYGDSFARPVWVNWLVLGGFVVLFLIATWAVLARRDSRAAS
ncbi:ABC transporter permease [Micromonospora tarensis]|uniref:ABC transporter permease n=1 Tax=Micromonospora tarensis TaxID=2806100 RepID=A0ABS1YAG5_9ACTN|nr:ABC transporter permease [Micromonospora tarensis]MBM0274388.1 ABC transporter permease [Micromonospora tarensis]